MAKANKTPTRIFVSSTYEDMIPFREAAEKSLIRLKQQLVAMEYFGSRNEDSLSTALAEVASSSLFVLLIGARYGSESDGISITEHEYNCAIKNNIPVLAYLGDDTVPLFPEKVREKDPEKLFKLNAFKDRIKEKHQVSFYANIDDLAKKISQDVPDALSKLDVDTSNIRHEEDKFDIGANDFQKFIVLPLLYNGAVVDLRFQILQGFNGGRVKEEVFNAHSLPVGKTMTAMVSVLGNYYSSVDSHNLECDFFASGDLAIDLLNKGIQPGDVLEAKCRMSCGSAFGVAAGRARETLIMGLVLLEAYKIDSSQRNSFIPKYSSATRRSHNDDGSSQLMGIPSLGALLTDMISE